jgi:class 3 adenylate cyclase/tetratricopeptide (TPR) repeat protein
MASRPVHPNRELATVLFTDVVDSTRHLAVSGDTVWARILDALDAVTRSEVRRRGGELVKSTGDGALVLLPSPTAAVECATALHDAAAQLGVSLRVGTHTGEIERRGTDVAGIAVHVAARLMGRAETGETLVSATVRTLASAATEAFDDRGELELKGVPEAVHAYAIRAPAREATELPPAVSDLDAVVRLLGQGRFEEAAEVARAVDDPAALADALVPAGGRVEFLDVDVTLVRMLEDVLDRLPEDEPITRSRAAAKLAFELRGDPSTAEDRRDLLDLATGLAQAAGDDLATSETLLAAVHALWEPAGATDRLAAAERVIALTRRTHHLEHELEARLARVHALIDLWRVQDAGLELATYARLAARLDRPDLNVFVASRRGLLAQISGRYEEQRRQGEIAYANAVAAGMPDADRLRIAQLSHVNRDCLPGSEYFEIAATMLRELADVMPGNYYEADVARMLLVVERTAEARAELARVLPSLLTSSGYRWLWGAVWAAEVAAAVGSDEACQRLYDALLPHQDALACVGPVFAGAVRERIGVLALRLGRPDEAVAHLRRTVDELDAIAALPWVARARAHLADALRSSGDAAAADRELAEALDAARALGMDRFVAEVEATTTSDAGGVWSLRRDGEDWLLKAGQEGARVRASRGIEHLAALLANPHRDLPAHQLDSGDSTTPVEAGIPLLDDQARQAYRSRLDEIAEEQESADLLGDQDASDRLERERSAILAELRRATGLGGRGRTTGASTERARVNVTRNLKRALEQIQRVAPLAGAHLAASIRTGSHCRYEPAPGGPASWQVAAYEPARDA